MTPKLSADQQRELDKRGGRPIQVVHPTTQKVYVIIAGELFDKVRALLGDDEFDLPDTYAAQSAAAGAAGWDDPEMDVYDNYDANKSKS